MIDHEQQQSADRTDLALPRGRHGLSREEVQASQRQRLEQAAVEAVASEGFAQITVRELVSRAAVSRQTFYELYGSKDDCVEQAMHAVVDGLVRAGRGPAPVPQHARARLARHLELMLDGIAGRPAHARCLFLEPRGASPHTETRAALVQAEFSTAFRWVLRPEAEHTADDLAALLRQHITDQVAVADWDTLRQLDDRILALVDALVPAAPERSR